MINKLKQYDFKNYNVSVLIIAIILGVLGAYVLKVMPDVVDDGAYLKQLLGVAFGVMLAIFVSLFDYHFIAKFYILMYLFNLLLLLLVKFTRFGISVYGAKRWLGIENVFSFQPSELTKIIMIVVVAKLFHLFRNRMNKWSTLIIIGAVMAVPTVLVLIQTDLSTSIVLFASFVVMVFVSGYSLKILGIIAGIATPVIAFFWWYLNQPDHSLLLKILKDYQYKRIMSLLHPEAYPDLIYQQQNATKAMSSGGLLGKTLTGDTGTRGTAYVPVVESDFIFTGIGEEFGFIGAATVIILILLLCFKMMSVSKNAPDNMGKIIAAGCAAIIMVQSFFNIGVVSWILPNTGIPLPFVSNGLSSVVSCYIMIGLVLNISINTKKNDTKRGDFE